MLHVLNLGLVYTCSYAPRAHSLNLFGTRERGLISWELYPGGTRRTAIYDVALNETVGIGKAARSKPKPLLDWR